MNSDDLLREIIRVDHEIAVNGKGRLTILKSYQRKLYRQYTKAMAA